MNSECVKQVVGLIKEGKEQVHITYADGTERVDEYALKGGHFLGRQLRAPRALGRPGDWVREVGESAGTVVVDANQEVLLRARAGQPVCSRLDSKKHYRWRIRNLAFPADVYEVCVENEHQVVVRTTNKKYFKRLGCIDGERLGCPGVDESTLQVEWSNNTLIVSADKQKDVVAEDLRLRKLGRENMQK